MAHSFSHIKKALVANRGEIAVRLIRAIQKAGIKSVSIYTTSDSTSLHATLADENILLPQDKADGYLDTYEFYNIRFPKSHHAYFLLVRRSCRYASV